MIEPNTILNCDVWTGLKLMPDQSVQCVVTSPPYFGLRDYGVSGQIGLEQSPWDYIDKMVVLFHEIRRVLRNDGTLWLNMGDTYVGSWGGYARERQAPISRMQSASLGMLTLKDPPPQSKIPYGMKYKDMMGMPWMLALALRECGWYLRSDIVWSKPNPMPSSVKDRPTTAHEYIFLLAKSERYYYDWQAIVEPAVSKPRDRTRTRIPSGWDTSSTSHPHLTGRYNNQDAQGAADKFREEWVTRNKRTVWECSVHGYKGAHFATFPEALIEPCILAGCPEGGIVYDPFMGAGTTAVVAYRNHRLFFGTELNPAFAELAQRRVAKEFAKFSLLDQMPRHGTSQEAAPVSSKGAQPADVNGALHSQEPAA